MKKKALFGFSFDDGRIDQFTIAYPILKKHGLCATFNITTSYIENKPTKWPFTDVAPMTLDMLRQLHADPQMEIASHGYWHHNASDNLLHGIKSLCEMLQVNHLYKNSNGIALTGNTVYPTDEKALLNNDSGIPVAYIRHSIRRPIPFLPKMLARKIDRVVPTPALYRYAMRDSLMQPIESQPGDSHSESKLCPEDNSCLQGNSHPEGASCHEVNSRPEAHYLYCIPIVGNKDLGDMKALVEKTICDQSACIFMMHSIVRDGHRNDDYEMEESRFEELCAYLAQCQKDTRLQVATSMDIHESLIDQ